MASKCLTERQRSLAFRFAHVGLPDRATDCEPWEISGEGWRRLFTVQEWRVGHLSVSVGGEQTHHGKVTYWLYVSGDEELTLIPRRQQLSNAMNEAAELLDSLR